MNRKISALILLVILVIVPAAAKKSAPKPKGSIDSQIAAEEKKRSDLAKQVKAYREQIKKMGAKVEGLLTKVNTLQQDESVARQELTVLELQSEKIQENIDVLDVYMREEQVKIDELSHKMSERLVDMYKYGDAGRMRTLFASRSVFEAVENAYLLKCMNDRDEAILSQLQEKVQNMDLSRRTMDDHQARLREKSEAVQTQRDKYKQSIKDTNRFITSLQRQKALAEKAALEAEEAQKAAGAMIAELQRKRARAFIPATGKGSKFDWPVRGAMSSPFGYRIHPILKRKILHAGIDIASPNGTPVKTAAPGEVIYNGWLRGYGRVVVIDHGRGFSTLYAHLSASLVHEGQIVKAGANIARVGRTGNVTGYHLHFEVRVYGTPADPIRYLKR
ncbi:MAG: peptidoglycan DD-metalloendopeptidase family protein [Synergistaceae bacterium]|nr:peptidoglycan DD-metalloendopeptidase family protein [Synergistaceae bacterium]MBQ3397349.1 peptidoglycan DD-metalloendopeptidase family protein [Synergistaceae bacterium]MBQ3759786.1 peptidoglycan DD-metalloendopeptidase family protein [Synergistaceae bacterium]MBQ4401743.1 peptidoglycan DD-metalloendopeptidase family protein [Synergistaceae bacterium]MBQ6417522.1 peptidoglycan DD-metalloendopeptidase family protein [Synergistaceae bacterium]